MLMTVSPIELTSVMLRSHATYSYI